MLTGCWGVGRIKAPGVSVQGVKDAGSPAILATSQAGEAVALPDGSRVIKTKTEAIPATKDAPAQPAKEVTEIIPAGPTVYTSTEKTVSASTGTIDTSIAARRIDAAENRILLYGALLMLVAAGVFFWLHYPSPALLCAAAAGVLFLCWKVANLPPWFWGIAVLAGAGAVGLYFGHERGEKNKQPTP
jgi:hypothetical protein